MSSANINKYVFIVSKLNQMALSRQEISQEQRRHFYVYIDEFHNFVTPSMESILSGARKMNLGLICAHQELMQAESRDRQVAASIIANPYTRVCFRLGDYDAKKLAPGFSTFDMEDLLSLGIGEAIVRIERSAFDFNLTAQAPPIPDGDAIQKVTTIRERSRKRFGTPVGDVETLLRADSQELEETSRTNARQETKVERPSVARTPKKPTEPTRPRLRARDAVPTMPSPGLGSSQHKYLQGLIKRVAEDYGFRATIEQPVLDGAGSVDVSLVHNDLRIACEISITTSPNHETGNVQKSLQAGYDRFVVLAPDRKKLDKLSKAALAVLADDDMSKVSFLLPEEFVEYLDSTTDGISTSAQSVRGYKVKVNYGAVDEEERKRRREAIAKVILHSLKRLGADS